MCIIDMMISRKHLIMVWLYSIAFWISNINNVIVAVVAVAVAAAAASLNKVNGSHHYRRGRLERHSIYFHAGWIAIEWQNKLRGTIDINRFKMLFHTVLFNIEDVEPSFVTACCCCCCALWLLLFFQRFSLFVFSETKMRALWQLS